MKRSPGAHTPAANIRRLPDPVWTHVAYPPHKAAETLQKWKSFLYQLLHLASISGWWWASHVGRYEQLLPGSSAPATLCVISSDRSKTQSLKELGNREIKRKKLKLPQTPSITQIITTVIFSCKFIYIYKYIYVCFDLQKKGIILYPACFS